MPTCGPAHPLIFDVQDHYDLPVEFRMIRGNAAEMVEPEELEELKWRAKPRYVSDLLLTLPFGVDRFLELIGKCRTQLERGMTILRALVSGGTARARMELDLYEALGSHLTSVENVVRFYQARDAFTPTRAAPQNSRSGLQRSSKSLATRSPTPSICSDFGS